MQNSFVKILFNKNASSADSFWFIMGSKKSYLITQVYLMSLWLFAVINLMDKENICKYILLYHDSNK